jgi:cytochrome P450
LPESIYERLSLATYGWEFHHGLEVFHKYGKPGNDKTFFLVTCGAAEISTRDPEISWEISRRPRDFRQPATTDLIIGRFGGNVLSANDESWAKQRKVVASVINERISKTVFNESIVQTEGLLAEVYDKADGKSTDTNQLFDMMKKITIHVLSGAGMGASVDWHSNANEKPREGYKLTYIEACKTVIEAVAGPIILPVWFMRSWPSFLPGHAFLQNLAPAMVEFPIHTKHLLDEERKRTSTQSGETRSNIMSQLLKASETDGKDGKALLSEDEMMGNLFVFTSAGFDTTANTLSYALVLLCRHPQWLDWVLEEVDNVMPQDPSEPVDYVAVFPKIVRIMSVMLEVLRLFTPVIHVARDTNAPQTIETSHATYHIPAGCFTYIDGVALHLDPDLWRDLNKKSPEEAPQTGDSRPDEYAFRPSRWVNPPGSQSALFQPPRGAYIPWSGGPRVCPGQKMAQVEFTAIFLTLFRRHRIEVVPLVVDGQEETTAQTNARLDALMKDSISVLTLQMKGVYDVSDGRGNDKGLKVRFSKRK